MLQEYKFFYTTDTFRIPTSPMILSATFSSSMSFKSKIIFLFSCVSSGMISLTLQAFHWKSFYLFSYFPTMQYPRQYYHCLQRSGRYMFYTGPSRFPSLISWYAALVICFMLQNNVNNISLGLVFPPIQASGFSADEFIANFTVPTQYGYAGIILGSSLAR